MKKWSIKQTALTLFYGVASVALIVVLLLTAVDFHCFQRSFYASQYRQLNTAQTIGMSQQDLDRTTEVLLDYIRGQREDLQVQAVINGTVQEVFNQREKDHMMDVRQLYLQAMNVRNLAAVIVLLAAGLVLLRRSRELLRGWCAVFVRVATVFLALIGALGFAALVDFNRFWTLFHQIFFRNDLWLLNPNTDILIMMVPESFFFSLVMRILVTFAIAFAVCFGAAITVRRRLS